MRFSSNIPPHINVFPNTGFFCTILKISKNFFSISLEVTTHEVIPLYATDICSTIRFFRTFSCFYRKSSSAYPSCIPALYSNFMLNLKRGELLRSPLISLLIFRLDQSVSIAFSLINNIDILSLCVDEYIEIMS